MEIQWGKNPEYSISICSNHNWWSGELALPVKLSWWNVTDAVGNKNNDIAITFLCFRFGLEIWRWKK
jgi:hypothetical protein